MDVTFNSSSCRDVHHFNTSLQCAFVENTSACDTDEGFINYTHVLYCDLSSHWTTLLMVILVLWLIVLFISMAVCADDFFCPPLVMIAKTLKMTDNIAGVTLLAFGNGAADVFSAIAAIKVAKDGDMGLAIGSLLGAGILLSTIIAGTIALMTPCHMAERPFLRDVIFFIIAVFMVFTILYDGQITLLESAGFLSIYLLYALVVIVGRYVYQYQKKKSQAQLQEDPVNEEDDTEEEEGPLTPLLPPQESTNIGFTSSVDVNVLQSELHSSPLKEFLMTISPLSILKFKASKWYKKMYMIVKIPAMFILQLTIPVVDYNKPKNGWNRHLNSLHCILSPLIAVFLADKSAFLYLLGGKFPVYALVIIIGTVLSIAVLLTSTNSQPPVYHAVFAYVAFAASVIWTNAFAGEIVSLLTTIGIASNISNAVLGLTLLAWGNSVADFVADFVMAWKGYPRAGLSACYGGPLFITDIMLGIGIPFVMVTAAKGTQNITFTLVQIILVVSLLVNLVLTLVLVPILKFTIGKAFGIFLYVIYAIFFLLVIFAETGVIKGQI